MIPLSAPDITEAEIAAVTAVLRTPQLSLGPQLAAFEAAFARYIGVPHAVAVSSGTAGLHLCLHALGLGPGDEVLVPSFTFIAAPNSIRFVQATPVFVEIDPETLNLSPAAAEAAITPRTRAILLVHTFGRPAPMDELLLIAEQHHLHVIEDACEALGAEYGGRRAGSFGHASVFAFYPNKQITTGEGGMILTRDPALANRLRGLRNQGRFPGQDWLTHAELGFNYRLSEMSCALGLAQLDRIDEILGCRDRVARLYTEALAGIPGLILPPLEIPNGRVSWFVFVVRLSHPYTPADREAVIAHLTAAGIGCARYFQPIHRQPAYAAWSDVSLPVTEREAARTIALPFFNRLTQNRIALVAQTLRAALLNRKP